MRKWGLLFRYNECVGHVFFQKEKGFFQIAYANVIEIYDLQINKADLEKIILSDLQIMMYPELEEKFLTILRTSGLPDLKFGNKIDFEKLYKERLN